MIALGFAASRSLGEESESVCGLSSALLLKLINPVGYRTYHIARRYTC